jgi:uncharacterized protein YndB with AHSA1/START domain
MAILVKVSHRYDASPERVFDAWLDPVKARKFFFATPDGEMVKAEIDPRVGGKFNFTDRRKEGDAEHFGEYVEIDRPRRLVFQFATSFEEEMTEVLIEIKPLDGGGCELTLSHEMSEKWVEYKDRTTNGWTMILETLEKVV